MHRGSILRVYPYHSLLKYKKQPLISLSKLVLNYSNNSTKEYLDDFKCKTLSFINNIIEILRSSNIENNYYQYNQIETNFDQFIDFLRDYDLVDQAQINLLFLITDLESIQKDLNFIFEKDFSILELTCKEFENQKQIIEKIFQQYYLDGKVPTIYLIENQSLNNPNYNIFNFTYTLVFIIIFLLIITFTIKYLVNIY